jgi:hypothetical protein
MLKLAVGVDHELFGSLSSTSVPSRDRGIAVSRNVIASPVCNMMSSPSRPTSRFLYLASKNLPSSYPLPAYTRQIRVHHVPRYVFGMRANPQPIARRPSGASARRLRRKNFRRNHEEPSMVPVTLLVAGVAGFSDAGMIKLDKNQVPFDTPLERDISCLLPAPVPRSRKCWLECPIRFRTGHLLHGEAS